jgi:hypothetical protein
VVAGGAVGTSSVTVVFNVPSGGACTTSGANTAPNAVKFVAPFKILSAAAVTGTVGFKTVATDAPFNVAGVTGGAITLVKTATPYDVLVAADTGATVLGLATPTAAVYSKLTQASDTTIGTFTVALKAASSTNATLASVAVVSADMSASVRPAITYDATVTATNGNFAVIKPNLNSTPMTLATPSASSATTLGVSGAGTVTAVIGATNTTSLNAAQTYSATITPKLATNTLVSTPAAVTGALQTITLEGISFVAPWVGGSLSGSQTYIRVSNSSSATGQVTVSLLNPTGAADATAAGSVCTSSTVAKLGSVPTSGELVIAPADLASCFGAFTRGDVVVTIQATKDALTAKARNVTATNVSEMTLGSGL